MKTWDQFYDYLLPWVPGCPTPMADLHLRLAARTFCEGTLCWRDWLDDVTTNGTDVLYDFETDTTQDVVQLLHANLDGCSIRVIRQEDVPGDWRTNTCIDRSIFAVSNTEQFAVVPLQAAGLIVQTEVALMPSLTASGVEDHVFKSYVQEIAMGAAASLHALPKKPYSDPQSTAGGRFKAAIDTTATDVLHSFSRAPVRTRARFL
jgi:hypothetical protein